MQQQNCPTGAQKLDKQALKAIIGGSNGWYVICTLSNHLGCYNTMPACEADCPDPSNCRWNDGCPNDLPPGDWYW